MVANLSLTILWVNLIQLHKQVHLHEKDDPIEKEPPETPTQNMVHECLTECGTDPSDIHNVLSVFNAKCDISSQDS